MIKIMFSRIFQKIIQHKVKAGIIFLLVLVVVYFGYKNLFTTGSVTRYVTTAAAKGTIIISVSGSGQVSASNQLDVKSKASGEIVYVGVKKGQEVKSGALLVKIDNSDAQETVENAQVSYDQVKLDLEKMKGLTMQTGSIRGVKEKAANDLQKAYDDGFNTVSNAFLNLPTVMGGLYDVLFGNTFTKSQQNTDWYADQVSNFEGGLKAITYKNDVNSSYWSSKAKYDENFNHYKATSRNSNTATIESLISETYDTIKIIADTIKNGNNYLDFVSDLMKKNNVSIPSAFSTHQSNLASYTGTTNTYLSSLLSSKTSIQSNKETLVETDFDIADQEIKLKQAENTLNDAKNKLANYYVYAPFSGTIAELDVKKGDSVSSGATVLTIISPQKIAEISLNEVDVAKVKVGQKTTLTFDAVEDLSLTGEATDVDTLGTVSQGVVSYTVTITFDTQDDRVKSGMSVSAAIITDMKQDVLLIPSAAVKSNGEQYVEVLENNTVRNQTVEVGLSNDTMTEIKSGLQEGDRVVTQTTTATTKTTTQTTSKNTGGGEMRAFGF